MGQYYIPYIENEDGKFTIYSHDYGNGLKLMEHSYMGNNFVNVVVLMIDIMNGGKPSKIGWIGDYSDDEIAEGLYEKVWQEDAYRVRPETARYFWDEEKKEAVGYGYFINIDKNEYVDLEKYVSKAKDKDGWTINPLPLLTAVGNGKGGGDYHSCYPNYDEVGRWFMDTIYFDEYLPEGLKDITDEVIFKEEAYATH